MPWLHNDYVISTLCQLLYNLDIKLSFAFNQIFNNHLFFYFKILYISFSAFDFLYYQALYCCYLYLSCINLNTIFYTSTLVIFRAKILYVF